MQLPKRSNKMGQSREHGHSQIRIWHRKTDRTKFTIRNPRFLLKCGCCDEKLEICYDEHGLEINGVDGSIEDWREILLPLLHIKVSDKDSDVFLAE